MAARRWAFAASSFDDEARGGRKLPVELWYPAAAAHRGQDLDDAKRDRFTIAPGLPEGAQHALRGAEPARGRLPLVLYFHGATGHRRDATELCTHLASHGYLVASPDFTGNTMGDMMHDVAGGAPGRRASRRWTSPPRIARTTRAS